MLRDNHGDETIPRYTDLFSLLVQKFGHPWPEPHVEVNPVLFLLGLVAHLLHPYELLCARTRTLDHGSA